MSGRTLRTHSTDFNSNYASSRSSSVSTGTKRRLPPSPFSSSVTPSPVMRSVVSGRPTTSTSLPPIPSSCTDNLASAGLSLRRTSSPYTRKSVPTSVSRKMSLSDRSTANRSGSRRSFTDSGKGDGGVIQAVEAANAVHSEYDRRKDPFPNKIQHSLPTENGSSPNENYDYEDELEFEKSENNSENYNMSDFTYMPQHEITVDILESSMVRSTSVDIESNSEGEGMLVPPIARQDRRLSISSIDQDTRSMEAHMLGYYLDTEDTRILNTASRSDLKDLIKRFLRLSAITRQFKRKQTTVMTEDPTRPESAAESEASSIYSLNYEQENWLAPGPNRQRRSSYFLTWDTTVLMGDDGSEDEDRGLYDDNVCIKKKGWIEEKISIDMMEKLKKVFRRADYDGSGQLDLEEFKKLFKKHLHITGSKEGQIDALFQKIDWSSEGVITWDEFCTYMQLEYAEKEDSYKRAKEVGFHLPARLEPIHHREAVLRITNTPDGMFIACSADGLVTFWSGSIEHKRTRNVITQEQSTRQKPKWITDFVLMPQYNKFIVGTGDREIQFFELSSFEPYCQIGGLDTVPLKLDYCSTDHDECMVLYGDSNGCVNIIVISSAGECLRTWKKAPKTEGIASVSIESICQNANVRYIRWKVHNDWIQQLKYYPEIRQVLSCSNNTDTALVMGCTTGSTDVGNLLKEIREPGSQKKVLTANIQPRPRLAMDQTVFTVHKGVKCFDFSKAKNIIITGGMDRIIRIWDPYVSLKPTGMLRGHTSPIFYLAIAEAEARIFSLSTDRCIKIWDVHDEGCLLTVRQKSHGIRGDLAAACYSSVSKSLCIATESMCVLQLKLKPGLKTEIVITHKEPIHGCIYNPNFKQVITCSDGSVIKLWDLETGSAIFEYGDAHGDSAITCMTFDSTGRRLITGGRDGCVRIWNYNNGHCLKTMMKEKGNEEICALQYVEMNKNRYVISVGWDKHINIYSDSSDENIRQVQPPLPRWPDDRGNGHREDILSVAQCPPNLLATSSFDGEIIVWNMVSGHIFCHLRAPAPPDYDHQSLDGDLSINRVLFLKTRAYGKDCASLVASGPRAHIHFWNVFHGGMLLAQFAGSRQDGAMVTSLETNKENKILVSADSSGFIYVWDIEQYCMDGQQSESPPLLQMWRGHVESITCMNLIQEENMLLSSSLDCTVRLWTLQGEYVGTFGQPEQWDIYNSATFHHPMVPYDVLVDPMSMPNHPIMQEKHAADKIIHAESIQNISQQEGIRPQTPTKQFVRSQVYINDEKIAERLKEKPYENAKGKRLRHEQKRPAKVDRANEYHTLKTYDLEPTPQPPPPSLRMNKDELIDVHE